MRLFAGLCCTYCTSPCQPTPHLTSPHHAAPPAPHIAMLHLPSPCCTSCTSPCHAASPVPSAPLPPSLTMLYLLHLLHLLHLPSNAAPPATPLHLAPHTAPPLPPALLALSATFGSSWGMRLALQGDLPPLPVHSMCFSNPPKFNFRPNPTSWYFSELCA